MEGLTAAAVEAERGIPCARCGGTGLLVTVGNGGGQDVRCERCNGTGRWSPPVTSTPMTNPSVVYPEGTRVSVPRTRQTQSRTDTIQQRFEEFHRDNPWVYDTLADLVADDIAHGMTRGSMSMYVELIRWKHRRATRSNDGYKINNDFKSRYARLLIDNAVVPITYFETRELRTA